MASSTWATSNGVPHHADGDPGVGLEHHTITRHRRARRSIPGPLDQAGDRRTVAASPDPVAALTGGKTFAVARRCSRNRPGPDRFDINKRLVALCGTKRGPWSAAPANTPQLRSLGTRTGGPRTPRRQARIFYMSAAGVAYPLRSRRLGTRDDSAGRRARGDGSLLMQRERARDNRHAAAEEIWLIVVMDHRHIR